MPQQPYPSWYSSDLWVNRGEKYALDFTVPENRFMSVVRKRKDTDSRQVIGRGGVNSILYAADLTDVYGLPGRHVLPNTSVFSGSGKASTSFPNAASNLTQSDVISAANTVPVCSLEGDQFGEGPVYAMDANVNAPQMQWWHQARIAKYQQAGKPYNCYGTYGSFAIDNLPNGWRNAGGGPLSPTDPYFANRLLNSSNARGSMGYFAYWFQYHGANIKNYALTLDYFGRYYTQMYAMERLSLGMNRGRGGINATDNKPCIYFFWDKIEGPGTTNGLEYARKITTAGASGTVFGQAHTLVDFDWSVGCQFAIGFCMGNGVASFDENLQFGTNPNQMAGIYSR